MRASTRRSDYDNLFEFCVLNLYVLFMHNSSVYISDLATTPNDRGGIDVENVHKIDVWKFLIKLQISPSLILTINIIHVKRCHSCNQYFNVF